jgi:hypothetical protein
MLNKIISAFDNKLEIYECAPKDNNMYHISEVCNFYFDVGYYYTYKNKTGDALLCYFLLQELDENHYCTENPGKHIVLNEIHKMYKKNSKKK